MNEPQWNQEAETFARVWQRVSPDLDARPRQPWGGGGGGAGGGGGGLSSQDSER